MGVAGLTFRSMYGNVPADELPDGIVLRGEVDWIAEGDEAALSLLLDVVAGHGRRVSHSAILSFGNAVGSFDLGASGIVHVRCGKLTDDDFDAMLAELTKQLAALPFSATQAAGIPHDRSIADRDDVVLHAFIYARHILLAAKGEHSLVRALDRVVRDPHRRFGSERAIVELAGASTIDTRTLTRMASGFGALRAPEHLAHSTLARSLRGFVPEVVDLPKATHSYDTAENRFVLEFIQQVRAIIERVERLASRKAKPSSFWLNTLRDCAAMRRALASFERHDMWNGVRSMDHVPIGSTVLQRRHGYKDVLRHYLTLRAAVRLPVSPQNVEQHLLGLKDVSALYELWCYFAVVDAVRTVLHRDPDSVDQFEVKIDKATIGNGFVVVWSGGPRVYYNQTFSSAREHPWQSSSLMLRPDVVLQIPRGEEVDLHVFDAKLKMDGVVLAQPNAVGDEDEDDQADQLKFVRDDLAKMHAYRDALPAVRSARVLYPGDLMREFRTLKSGARDIEVVGAVPLVPGKAPDELVEVLERILGKELKPIVAGGFSTHPVVHS